MSSPIKDIGGGFGTKSIGGHRQVAGPYAADAMYEMRMHAENVHHKDSTAERLRRERGKVYEQAKRELAEARALRPTE